VGGGFVVSVGVMGVVGDAGGGSVFVVSFTVAVIVVAVVTVVWVMVMVVVVFIGGPIMM
jgi:hypothetical protein